MNAIVDDYSYNNGIIINGNVVSTDIQNINLDISGDILANGWIGADSTAQDSLPIVEEELRNNLSSRRAC